MGILFGTDGKISEFRRLLLFLPVFLQNVNLELINCVLSNQSWLLYVKCKCK